MDIASIIGFVVGIGSIAFGYSIDGGSLRSLVLVPAMIIVIGGTVGAVFLSYGLNNVLHMPITFIDIFKLKKSKIPHLIDSIVRFSEAARKEGLLSLEKVLESEQAKNPVDPLLRHGIIMIVDGTDLNEMRDLLESQIYIYEERINMETAIFESAATYAPAMGMIGTIIGLIQLLANLTDPDALSKGIAVAFITTLYGSLIANLFCLPVARKLKNRLRDYRLEKELIIDGVSAIRNGENPKLVREKLSCYLLLDGKGPKAESTAKGNKKPPKEKK